MSKLTTAAAILASCFFLPSNGLAQVSFEDASQRLVRTFTGHSGGVHSIAASRDGRSALSGGQDGTLRLWDVTTGALLRILALPKSEPLGKGTGIFMPVGVWSVALSPDSTRALSGLGNQNPTLILWDVASGRVLGTFAGHTKAILSVALSADGRRALSASSDGTVKFWDVATGRLVRTLTGHSGWVTSVAFLPDDTRAISAGSGDDTIKVWDLSNGQVVHSFTHGKDLRKAALSPDGRSTMSGWGSGPNATPILRLSDVTTGREILSFQGPNYSIAFAPDGRTVLSGGCAEQKAPCSKGTIKLWLAATGQELREFAGHAGNVTSLAFVLNGRFALSGSTDGTIKLWDVSEWTSLRR